VWLTVACTLAAVAAVLVRVSRAREASSDARTAWGALALATPLGIAVFALLGPLQGGWAARAGTPSKLLAHHATSAAALTRTPVRPFSATIQGTLRQHSAPGGRLVDLVLTLRGGTSGILRVRLAGRPVGASGLSLVGSQVDLSAPSLGPVMAGRVVALSGTTFRARLEQSGGHAWTVDVTLSVDSASGQVGGRVAGTPEHA
jgi:hypothetical protein